MSESVSGEVKWDDVDKGTFLRFIQFTYTGDYSVPIPQSCIAEANDRQVYTGSESEIVLYQEPPADVEAWDFSFPTKKDKKRKNASATKLMLDFDSFSSLSYQPPKVQTHIANAQGPCLSDDGTETSFRISLAHASLYVLAEKWGIDRLKQLTLCKIHQTLSAAQFDASKVQDLVELVRYIYSGTPDLDSGIDELRKLICYYIATNGGITAEHATFAALLREEGGLAPDLWKIVGSKINVAE
jgi:hypothetical protein